MRKTFILILSFLAWQLAAQDFNKTKLDSLFMLIDQHKKGMGSISIFNKGQEVYANTFGYADYEKKLEADRDTKYRIGSISKTFTAAIIMQMKDEGLIGLDQKLSVFYPEMPNAEKISIENLLRHRSGLVNFTSEEDYTDWMEVPKTKDELLEVFNANGTIFEPGAKFEYSNTNYVLLSFIAEDIDSKAYAEILHDRIVEPLDLNNTYFGAEINTDNNEARSYAYMGSWVRGTETDMSIPLGAGGVVSTPEDLNSFQLALHRGEVVSDSSLKEMKTLKDGYGIGMFVTPFYEFKGFGHTGGIDGFHSVSSCFPSENVAISYCSNAEVMPLNDILIGALSIYFGKDYELPEFKTLDLSADELEKYPGTYSSESFPLKVTISREDNKLFGQATGQPSFPLEAYEQDKFRFDQAGLRLEFIPSENKMILKQAGQVFELIRE